MQPSTRFRQAVPADPSDSPENLRRRSHPVSSSSKILPRSHFPESRFGPKCQTRRSKRYMQRGANYHVMEGNRICERSGRCLDGNCDDMSFILTWCKVGHATMTRIELRSSWWKMKAEDRCQCQDSAWYCDTLGEYRSFNETIWTYFYYSRIRLKLRSSQLVLVELWEYVERRDDSGLLDCVLLRR
jgi:hypothetical protein